MQLWELNSLENWVSVCVYVRGHVCLEIGVDACTSDAGERAVD